MRMRMLRSIVRAASGGIEISRSSRLVCGIVAGLLAANFCLALEPADEVRKFLPLDGEWSLALDPQGFGEKESRFGPEMEMKNEMSPFHEGA
jgi:hypothetical protein